MTHTEGQQHRAAVTQRGSLALGTVHLFHTNYSRTNHLQLRELTAIPSSAWHRAGSENTHEILSQDNQPGAQKLGLQMYRRSGARMGAEQGPQLPTSSPPRGAFLQACTLEDSSDGSTTAQPGIHCNPALPWSLETPSSPAPYGSPPTHTRASWSLPQSTPPAPLFIQDALWEGLISAVS